MARWVHILKITFCPCLGIAKVLEVRWDVAVFFLFFFTVVSNAWLETLLLAINTLPKETIRQEVQKKLSKPASNQ